MNIFVYSDESGVFDQIHNKKFVFGGLIFFGKDSREECIRKYKNAEKSIYESGAIEYGKEIKASAISNKNKDKLYRSLNNYYKFGAIIKLRCVLQNIFSDKKTKQRFLDYAYKIAVKNAFAQMLREGLFSASEVENIYFFVDEHTTATNGRYELREALEQELKVGTYNHNWHNFYPPLFPKMKKLELEYCNSASKTLVRAADIVANKIYYKSLNEIDFTDDIKNRHLYLKYLP